MKRKAIGVDLMPLRAPLTGIPNYIFNLLTALNQPKFERYDLFGFDEFSWRRLEYSRPIIEKHDRVIGDGASLTSILRRSISKNEFLRRLFQTSVLYFRGVSYDYSVPRGDLIFFHALSYRPPGMTLSVPCVPVIYDMSFVRYPGAHPSARLKWLEALPVVAKRSPLIHTISNFSAREISEIYGIHPSKIRVIPPGISPIYLQENVQDSGILTRLGLNRGRYWVSVGTLEPRKNLQTLLNAFAKLPSRMQMLNPLVLVGMAGWGDVVNSEVLKKLVSRGSVKVAGHVSDVELHNLYSNARALFYPSVYEGFGMPITEALALGCPVVTSNVASMPEAANGGARLVHPLDVDAWHDELARACDDDDFSDPEERQRRKACVAGFSWDRSADLTYNLYDEVASML